MRRGEIWWAKIPARGASSKRRPMLVVSDDAFNENERYPKVMVVHLTSVERLGGPFDWEVGIPKGVAGLSRSSVVKCSEIYTLWKEQLQGPAATLPGSLMRSVDGALVTALGLRSAPVTPAREQE
jgi:mRNA-degrading endonuclease toxin of MazEF toxin-antitoxin module